MSGNVWSGKEKCSILKHFRSPLPRNFKIQRSANAAATGASIKQKILHWCQNKTRKYEVTKSVAGIPFVIVIRDKSLNVVVVLCVMCPKSLLSSDFLGHQPRKLLFVLVWRSGILCSDPSFLPRCFWLWLLESKGEEEELHSSLPNCRVWSI